MRHTQLIAPAPYPWQRGGCTDDVTRSENVANLSATLRVDSYKPAFARSQTRGGEIQVGGVALPPGRDQDIVHRECCAGRKLERDIACRRGIAVCDLFFPDKAHSGRRHRAPDVFRNLAIEKTEEPHTSVDQIHFDPECSKVQAYSPDYARANHGQRFGAW